MKTLKNLIEFLVENGRFLPGDIQAGKFVLSVPRAGRAEVLAALVAAAESGLHDHLGRAL